VVRGSDAVDAGAGRAGAAIVGRVVIGVREGAGGGPRGVRVAASRGRGAVVSRVHAA
jgi:hypothetical protein